MSSNSEVEGKEQEREDVLRSSWSVPQLFSSKNLFIKAHTQKNQVCLLQLRITV